MYFFKAGSSSEKLLFQKNLFRSTYFLRAVTEKLALRNQIHSIHTWKGFPLTIIHSFKYSVSWSGTETCRFYIVENDFLGSW